MLAEVRDELLSRPGLRLCSKIVRRDSAIVHDIARAGLPGSMHNRASLFVTVLDINVQAFWRPGDELALRRLPGKHAKAIAAYPQLDTLLGCAQTHFDLIELISENAFGSDDLFRIRSDSASLIREIQAYRLRRSDRVLDVGTGSGFHPMVLARVDLSVVAEDIFGEFQQFRFEGLPPESRDLISAVTGTKESTTLEGETFDVIIARNAFHHFKHHQEMLASLRASMRPGSRLLIVDSYKDLEFGTASQGCGDRLKLAQARERLASAGFELTREQQAGEWWLMEYALR